jgi:hypothetical protein
VTKNSQGAVADNLADNRKARTMEETSGTAEDATAGRCCTDDESRS